MGRMIMTTINTAINLMDIQRMKHMETDRVLLWERFLLRMKYLNRVWILHSLHNGIVGRVYTLWLVCCQ